MQEIINECSEERSIHKRGGHPCIPIDRFIEKTVGVCRHHALVAAYLLDRFMQENWNRCTFTGKVQIMGDDIKGGGHAWLTLLSSVQETWAFDSLNNIIGNLNEEEFKQALIQKFGADPVERQIYKANLLRHQQGI